jgi:hypothetical protein
MLDRKRRFLVWLSAVRRTDPMRTEKKDCRVWVVLTPGKEFRLLARPDDERKERNRPVENRRRR